MRKAEITVTLGRKADCRISILEQASKNNIQVIERSIEDEVLLTELALDQRDLVVYDISSEIYSIQRDTDNLPESIFKCFYDERRNDFFIELTKDQESYFTRSFFLQLCDIAEEIGAKRIYVCLRIDHDMKNIVQSLQFVGFEKLTFGELRKISITKTHTMYKINL